MVYDGPRFRRDLISTVFYEGGVRCVDVHDPKRGATFRLFDYEYSVALAFDGRDLAKVISWVRVSTGLELNQEQLTTFAGRLDQLGFLEKPNAEREATPPPLSETPTPPPAPRASARPRDEAKPGPEAGSLAMATRPPSGERLAKPGAAPTPSSVSAATETPESEPLAGSEPPAGQSPPSDDRLQVAADDAVPERIEPEGDEVLQTIAAEDSDDSELPGATAPLTQEHHDAATAPVGAAPETAPAPESHAHQEAATAEADPAPSSSAPELPVAVGPSPERIRERPVRRSARLPTQAHARSAGVGSRRQVTPPPIPRQGQVTPAPLPVSGTHRSSWMLSAFFGILAALVVGAVVAPFALGTRPPAPVSVLVIRAQPTEVVRWIDVTAPIEAPPLQTLSFPTGGKVLRIASPGLELRPGDVVAATDAARTALADWARAQEQLAFAKQMVQGLRDSNDEERIPSAEAMLTERTAQQEKAHTAVSKVAITATEPSTVEQTLASLGQTVQAGSAAVRLRRPGWRARFEMHRLPAAQLRKQGLCLAEISGRPVPCSFVPEEEDGTHLVISLPTEVVQTPGMLTHLARTRVLDAYVLPASALSDSNGKPRVLVVAPNGRTEMRSVVLADRTAEDAVVTQGLDPGDAVVTHSALPVGAGTPVRIVKSLDD